MSLKVNDVDLACPLGAAIARLQPGFLLMVSAEVNALHPLSTPSIQMSSSSSWNLGDFLIK